MTDFFAPCPRGLETVLFNDLVEMGGQNVRATEGGVHFSGDWALCYRVNLENRVASRVLWRVKEGWYRTEQDIYKAVFDLQWQRWFNVTHTIRVNTTAIRCALKSLEFITLLVKDAVCDRFRAHCDERPSVDTLTPDVRIHVFLEDEKLMLYLDTSGDPLFKRGVRQNTNIAPIRENLAAGILRLSGWTPGTPLLDPMCGSGTFLIEAVQMSLNIQPGIARSFAFEKLLNFDKPVWQAMKQAAIAAQVPPKPLEIYGSDMYGDAMKTAWRNLSDAGLSDCVELNQANILEISAPAEHGIMVANLPYGERMGELDELAELYPKLGDTLKRKFGGWTAYLFTADKAILKLMRLSPSKRTPLFNGAIECRLLEYKIVSGSNRPAK
ncbi:THUMP domain-containing class I SAM-dependent RNA methyltransferase [Gallionella capsiferriformans]|uniref:rRNA (Guanine-N(2)-)-methyltransferase n=1 Tax=Gallionella capsiferriformans (strain ES-2) TaxID=395494 RepID=D9SE78_GALCS|nr:THUMP domain-containing protein [Gallionella capsiferriformans]ADL56900.1 rRNA (guanine-N(2)-)-methyltransferase [Gallionella capsiferriformans ES-2]